MKKIIYLTAILATTSCASITRGVNEDVIIQYTPTDAIVRTSLNHQCALSPCTVKVPRKSPFQVFVSKPGYESMTVNVETKLAGKGAAGFAGNVLLGGVGGMVVDASTGATLDHHPNPVIINLVPIGTSDTTTVAPTVPNTTSHASESGAPTS